jgi:formylglycine-generating enzyme required for sulfatase activity
MTKPNPRAPIFMLFGAALLILAALTSAVLLALRLAPALRPTVTSTSAPTATPTVTPLPLPVEITDAQGVPMRLVPAGAFTMGSADDTSGLAQPVHTVTLDSFYMDVYEVTRGRYRACVTAGVCSESKNLASPDLFYAEPDYPMAAVDWNQAQTYCAWRGARLPGEAEWEKAARSTDGRTYPWGADFDAQYAAIRYEPKTGGPTKVGSYEKGQSPYGLYDLAGSVWEWTADPFQAYPGNEANQNLFRPAEKILRGGSWFYPDQYALSTWFRYSSPPQTAVGYIGFRCAKPAP